MSIIIPAYNEERHLPGCLDSIAAQKLKPDEVIVVDNNSTDNTVEIAKSYDFVTLIHEKTQGLIAARNRGMNYAKSDLLARIDVDSILDPNWVEIVKDEFSSKEVDSITGPARSWVDTHLPSWHSTFWSRVYFAYALATFRIHVLWGPNMVIRKSVWGEVYPALSTQDRLVHEDQDLSVQLRLHGYSIKNVPRLMISTDSSRFASPSKLREYSKRHRTTLLLHRYDLAKIKRDVSLIEAISIRLMIYPLWALFGIFTAIYHAEVRLGLRKV